MKEYEGMFLNYEMKSRIEGLIKKIQENKIDTIGFGLHALANQYEQYKKVEDQWGKRLRNQTLMYH